MSIREPITDLIDGIYPITSPDRQDSDLPWMRLLHSVHTRFLSRLAASLSTLIGASTVSLSRLQVLTSRPAVSTDGPCWVIPFAGTHAQRGVLAFDDVLSLLAIDHLMGALGDRMQAGHPISEIERHLLQKACAPVLSAYSASWDPSVSLSLQANADSATSFPEGPLYQACYEVRTAKGNGQLHVELPLAEWEPLLANQPSQAPPPIQNVGLLQAMGHCTVEATVILGSTRITLQELLGIQVGDIVRLDKDPNAPFEIRIANRPRLSGQAHVEGEHFVITVEQKLPEGTPHESR